MSRRPKRARPASAAPLRVGVDTGGTFTDFVARIGGNVVTLKEPSTPDAPERAVLRGLARLGATRETRVRHGSTVATNALLERKGARVALLTTAGFEDLIEIGRQQRPDLYALEPRRMEPLVPRARRIGVDERLAAGGAALVPLGARAIARAVRRARRTGAETIAVCLLHSYAHPRHERRLSRALRALGRPVSVSSELCPEIREVERFTTTVVNAYLMPRVGRYLERLRKAAGPRLEIVLSHGGSAPAAEAAREPVRQLLSGPAAGLEAAFAVARACGFERALTLDVGGTSTDVAFADGVLPRRRAREVAGFPIQLPLLDVHTVGAGGGSIAWLDAGGLLRVGPKSAGARPGPAAYGFGGPATVTDALVVLGRLPEMTLGGDVRLTRAPAARALGALAPRLGLSSAEEVAAAVVAIADAHMEAALRLVSVERGHDPRGAALVAFGGAGGLHACALAAALGCEAVVFPAAAGVLSALGALAGEERREKSRSVLLPADDARGIARALEALERDVRAGFERAARARVRIERRAELRYAGQAHELSVAVGPALAERFHREHERRFGYADRARAVEVVTLDVRGALPAERLPAFRAPRRGARAKPERASVRVGAARRGVAVWRAEALPTAFATRGPALLLEDGATLWVAPGWRARRHSSGAFVLLKGGGA